MIAKIVRPLLFLIAVLVLIAVAIWALTTRTNADLSVAAVEGARPAIAKPDIEQIPTVDIAKPVGWQDGAHPTAAPGLRVNSFAAGLDHPRWMLLLPNGDVLVAETNSPPREADGLTGVVMGWILKWAGAAVPSPNRITLLRDTNGDGVADYRSVLLTGLNSPTGMALVGNKLYVADTDALLAFPFTPGETRITAKPEKIVDLPAGGHHWARNVVANPAGTRLYVSVGSSTNIAENGIDAEDGRAAIWEVDPVTKRWRIFAGGMRNPNGMAWEPQSQALWSVVNERDMLGGDTPPDYLTHVGFGDFYGWPYSYWGGYVDKRVEPARPDLLEYTRRPDFALGPHVAALGLTFANGAHLGPQFANGAFIGEHGSWNRKPVSGYKVVYVPFGANGFPAQGAKPVAILTGFLDEKGHARGRPVGVILDKTGALLVADDVGNRIWRVSR